MTTMDARPRHSSPRPAPRRALLRFVVPRPAACRRCRATARAPHRTAATRGSATTTTGAPRSRRAPAARAWDRGRDRAGRGTARRSRRGPARVPLRRRGTPVAVAATPAAEQRSSSRPGLYCWCATGSGRRSDLAARAGRANQRLIGGIDLVAMLGTRKHAGAHVARVVAECPFDGAADFGISLHEPWRDLADEVAEHVVRNDELPVHLRPGADPVDKYADALAHKRRRLGGDGLEQNREYARQLQRLGVAQQLLRRG